MPDKRLIDANALHKVFDAMHAIPGSSHLDHLVLLGIKKFIDDTPTIDAAEVVRCKECKYLTTFRMNGINYPLCMITDKEKTLDGFCDDGAKMDGGADK